MVQWGVWNIPLIYLAEHEHQNWILHWNQEFLWCGFFGHTIAYYWHPRAWSVAVFCPGFESEIFPQSTWWWEAWMHEKHCSLEWTGGARWGSAWEARWGCMRTPGKQRGQMRGAEEAVRGATEEEEDRCQGWENKSGTGGFTIGGGFMLAELHRLLFCMRKLQKLAVFYILGFFVLSFETFQIIIAASKNHLRLGGKNCTVTSIPSSYLRQS